MQENCYQLRVELSAKGKRVVKGRYSDSGRNPYGSRCHKYGEKMENCSDQKLKNMLFKITIPYGRNYDKMWLLNSIENECGFYFQAIQFHYVKNMAAFFVDDFSTAKCLVRASKKIQGAHYHKIIIRAEPFYRVGQQMEMSILSPLHTVSYLDHRAEHIQSCLRRRYDRSLENLDLSSLANDPDLLSANIHFSVNNPSVTGILLQVISECYPQLLSLNLSYNKLSKLTGFAHLFYLTPHLQSLDLSYNKLCTVQDLDLIHNLELRELWLEGNPLRGAVESHSAYYRLITYHFPAIEKLDGLIFKENLFFEHEEPKPLPETKGSFFVSDEIKSYLAKFLHQFFTLYDSGERKTLLPLYHENACCSFSLPNVVYPKACFSQIKEYWKENRNLLRVKRPDLRHRLIKYNRLQVVGFLCNLPKTEHDLPSMTLDVSFQTTSLMCFTVEGKFKEVDVSCQKTLFIPFRRTFIIVPASEDSAQILNDQMVILNSYVDPQETSSCVASKSVLAVCDQTLPPASTDAVSAFSKYTGMKRDWALNTRSAQHLGEHGRKRPCVPCLRQAMCEVFCSFLYRCLEDNNWDIQKAKETFNLLKVNDFTNQPTC